MRKLMFLVFLTSAISCNNSTANRDGSGNHPVTIDTSIPGTIITDSTGAKEMNTDTAGMGRAL